MNNIVEIIPEDARLFGLRVKNHVAILYTPTPHGYEATFSGLCSAIGETIEEARKNFLIVLASELAVIQRLTDVIHGELADAITVYNHHFDLSDEHDPWHPLQLEDIPPLIHKFGLPSNLASGDLGVDLARIQRRLEAAESIENFLELLFQAKDNIPIYITAEEHATVRSILLVWEGEGRKHFAQLNVMTLY
ncbi:hypothetical protein COU76_02440 [Candidatus Peregrinibacteria bacterium CG10_big_fil_rev_8_21_14_0_10_49_10]|nr:MAG: hypothetical protein COU76_02440 [Candidatus Peregrinibacteria bacterium CG10_big_fil_rev_8_21_14_0_10_49_10]